MRLLHLARNEQQQQGADERREQDHAQDVICKIRVHSYCLSAHGAQQNLHMMTVISQKDHKSNHNQHRVAGKHSGLQQPDGITEKLHQLGAEIQQPVDDPLIPPHGHIRNETGEPAGAVHAEPVNHFGVEAAEQSAEVFGAIHDGCVVNFVHVILVEEQLVELRQFSGDQFGRESLGAIKFVSEPNARRDNGKRQHHQDDFFSHGVVRDLDHSRLRYYAGQDGFEKPLETVLAPERARPSDPAADDRKSRENDERNGHGPRRFVDMFLNMFVRAAVAEEGKEEQPKHVKRRQARGDETYDPEQEKAVEGLAENFIFAEKPGERKNSSDRNGGDQHGDIGVLD